jgi:hypothetical protein
MTFNYCVICEKTFLGIYANVSVGFNLSLFLMYKRLVDKLMQRFIHRINDPKALFLHTLFAPQNESSRIFYASTKN